MTLKHEFVLGLHPSSRGFGWILFEGPLSPFDWGTSDIRLNKNRRALAEVEWLLDKYQPRVIAIEAYDNVASRRSVRIRRLCQSTLRRAELRGIDIHVFTRDQIRLTFVHRGVRTREGIAAAVAEHVPILQTRLPKPRKIWVGEHPSQALFSAAACALTYYAAALA